MRVAIEDCGVWRFTVACVEMKSAGWQHVSESVDEGSSGIGIPPIEYTIKPGDEIEVWFRRMTVPWVDHDILGTKGQFFRINGIGRPLPYPQDRNGNAE